MTVKLIVITVNGNVELATTDKEYAETTKTALERGGCNPMFKVVWEELAPHPDFEETWL